MSDTTESLVRRYAAFKPDEWDGDDYDLLIVDALAALKERDAEITEKETECIRLINECERLRAALKEREVEILDWRHVLAKRVEMEAAATKECERLRKALVLAEDTMISVNVFVHSKEKIKHPEGTDWYADRIQQTRQALEGE